MRSRLIPETEIVLTDYQDVVKLIDATVNENTNYVAMVSREEQFYVVSFLYSDDGDRNNVVFMDRGEFDSEYINREVLEEDDV